MANLTQQDIDDAVAVCQQQLEQEIAGLRQQLQDMSDMLNKLWSQQ
jgi:flagellar capping protein FliD